MRNLDYGVKFLQFCRLTKIIIYNMSMEPFLRTKGPDIAFAIVVMALGAVSIVEGLSIRPSRFDPLGPGAVPAMIGVALCILAGAVLLSTATSLRIGDGARLFTGLEDEAGSEPLLWQRALAAFVTTLAYVAVLELRLVGYLGATFAYTAFLWLVLGRRDARGAAIALVTAAVTAGLLDTIFRRLLSIDLP